LAAKRFLIFFYIQKMRTVRPVGPVASQAIPFFYRVMHHLLDIQGIMTLVTEFLSLFCKGKALAGLERVFGSPLYVTVRTLLLCHRLVDVRRLDKALMTF
jgi:hypothetical protein